MGAPVSTSAVPQAATQNPSANGVANKGAASTRYAMEDHVHPALNQQRVLFSKTGMDLNSTADQALTQAFAFSDYLITAVVLSNVSTTLAASLATVGVYTGAGASGTTIVTAALVQSLTSAAKAVLMTLLNQRITGSTLYAKLGVAHGSVATCDIHVLGVPLT